MYLVRVTGIGNDQITYICSPHILFRLSIPTEACCAKKDVPLYDVKNFLSFHGHEIRQNNSVETNCLIGERNKESSWSFGEALAYLTELCDLLQLSVSLGSCIGIFNFFHDVVYSVRMRTVEVTVKFQKLCGRVYCGNQPFGINMTHFWYQGYNPSLSGENEFGRNSVRNCVVENIVLV